MLIGFDVSQFNPPKLIPWHTASFACIRLTSGTTLDTLADEHLRRASGAGVGLLLAYGYLRGNVSGEEQAKRFLERVTALEAAEHVGPLALAVDIEDPLKGPPWDRATYTTAFAAFVGWLHEHDPRPCAIYVSPGFMASGMGTTPIIRASPLWLADWTPPADLPKGWDRWTIWQNEVKDIAPGVPIDHDVFAGTAEDWTRIFHPPAAHDELGGVVLATQRAAGHGPGGVQDFESRDEGPIVEPA
jgi:GH25 family lysozyme M1 (1,4-beta-N-acetylmuramidase)